MAVSVNVFVQDTQISPQAISGVVVNVYDATTLSFITSATTDGSGQAALLLPGSASPGTSYEVRFYKAGVIFQNPRIIQVIEPISAPQTNDFDMSGDLVTLPIATDPRMCRCTGQFVGFGGQPVPNTLVRVLSIAGSGTLTKPPDTPIMPWTILPPTPPPNILTGFQVPKVLDGKMVSLGAMEFRTDSNGRVSFDLIRTGQYYVTFAGEEDAIWSICVPDRSSVNLIELIHPEPKTLTWDSTEAPGNSVTVAVGQLKSIPFSVLFSNYIAYAKNLAHIIQFTNSDGDLADVVYNGGTGAIEISGRAPGSLNITVSVIPYMTPARVPDYSISASPLSVTITP